VETCRTVDLSGEPPNPYHARVCLPPMGDGAASGREMTDLADTMKEALG
jgi:hypothetical protein